MQNHCFVLSSSHDRSLHQNKRYNQTIICEVCFIKKKNKEQPFLVLNRECVKKLFTLIDKRKKITWSHMDASIDHKLEKCVYYLHNLIYPQIKMCTFQSLQITDLFSVVPTFHSTY